MEDYRTHKSPPIHFQAVVGRGEVFRALCAFISSGRIKVEMKLPIQLGEKVGRSTPAQVFAA